MSLKERVREPVGRVGIERSVPAMTCWLRISRGDQKVKEELDCYLTASMKRTRTIEAPLFSTKKCE